jgi:hypothetical protein
MSQRASDWTDSLGKRPKLKKMDMRFGRWNKRNLYRSGSRMTVSKEISEYKLHLVGVQEVRWDRGGTEPAGEYTYFYGEGNEDYKLGRDFFYYIRESYQQLRG